MKRILLPAFLAIALAGAALAQTQGTSATIVVRLPADAKLTIGSQQTQQRGSERRFLTPDLAAGSTYWYQLEATWLKDGKEVKVERAVEFKAGQVAVVDLRPAPTKVAEVKATPKKVEVKIEPKKVEVKVEPKKVEVKVEPKKVEVKVEPKKVEVKVEVKVVPKLVAGVEPGFTALFNGKDLAGWKTITSGKDDGDTFMVKEGVIVVRGQPAGYFYTDKSYQNYVLRYDWKFIKNGNSGILVHIQGKHNVWPKCVEVQGMQTDHGHIFAIGGAKGQFKTDRDNQKKAIKLLEWNTGEIVCKDGAISSFVNGLPISTGTADLTEGQIGFQSEGVELHFKNIRIKTLPASATPPKKVSDSPKKSTDVAPPKTSDLPKKPAVVAPKKSADAPKQAAGDGFKDLFNGTNLDGWKTFLDPKAKDADAAKSFIVKDGEIQVPGFPNGYFYTEKSYKNYVLRYDWTFPKDQPEKSTMNSGLLVHIQTPHAIWPKSVEPQGRYKDHGKIFFPGYPKDGKPAATDDDDARKKALKAHYEWHTTEVICKADGTISVSINGIPVAGTKTELTQGPIGFQSEGARVHFRNIKIKMMD